MSLLARTMSMLESIVVKKGQSRYMACKVLSALFGCAAVKARTAAPNPYQPGKSSRHCAQENTQGMARKSSMRVDFVREAGRLPILRLAISPITVDSQK